jgi:hypothetical protein
MRTIVCLSAVAALVGSLSQVTRAGEAYVVTRDHMPQAEVVDQYVRLDNPADRWAHLRRDGVSNNAAIIMRGESARPAVHDRYVRLYMSTGPVIVMDRDRGYAHYERQRLMRFDEDMLSLHAYRTAVSMDHGPAHIVRNPVAVVDADDPALVNAEPADAKVVPAGPKKDAAPKKQADPLLLTKADGDDA